MEHSLHNCTAHRFIPNILRGAFFSTFLCFFLTHQIGQSQCVQSLGKAQVLCYSPNGNGSTTLFLAEGNNIVQKVLDKNGATISTSTVGTLAQDSISVKNNQVTKKLANGTIAFTKNIPPSVLNPVPSITAAVEMADGTFVLGGYQKFFDPIFPPNNKDSLVLVTTDANLNFQNAVVHTRGSGPYTPQLDALLQLLPLPNNQFLVTYYAGFVGIINRASFSFASYQKNGANLSMLKTSAYGYQTQNQPIITSVCGKNMILHGDVSTYGQKSSFRGRGNTLFNIDSMLPITSRTVGTGNVDYYGDYKSYSYVYKPVLRDTAYQLAVNYAGDPRPSLNDFSKLEIRFFNNTNVNTSSPTFTKTIPFVAFDHVIRTGDTTCLVLTTENEQLLVSNPDCNTIPNLPDLTLANLNLTARSVQQGEILNWKVDIKNIGTGNAPSNFTIKAYISKDNVLSIDDVQDGIIPTGNFAAGYSVFQVKGASTIATNVPAGQYYLILKIDTDGQITEGDETNNVLVSSTTFIVTNAIPISYCVSKGVMPWELWTRNVTFNTLNNPSEKFKDYATLGYSDYTDVSTTVAKAQTYPLSILPPVGWTGYFPNVFCRVWIDFNRDNIFDGKELVLEQTNANLFTTNVFIPANAETGSVRMRVSMKWGDYPMACETFEKGEVEDYTVNITDGSSVINTTDLALSLTPTPSVYRQYTAQNFTISAKNNGNQAFTNVKIEFKFPTGTTNGGVANPSIGTWQEWCSDGTRCFTWTIPTLAASTTATLNIPVYVLNPASPMVATAKLLASTPVDNVLGNNTATISLNSAPLPIPFESEQRAQQLPIVVGKIAPNPSEDKMTVELESLDACEVQIDFLNTVGGTVFSEKRTVEKGLNRLLFDVSRLPQGIYFVSPSTSIGKNVPTKFVKM